MKHYEYDEHFEPPTIVSAEGAVAGIATCKECGAAVLLDSRDRTDRARQHHEWLENQRKGVSDE